MIQLTVTGVYRERNKEQTNNFVRSFQRTLFIVPNNNGFCIRNELFHVNNASAKQERNAFKGPSLNEISAQQVRRNFLKYQIYSRNWLNELLNVFSNKSQQYKLHRQSLEIQINTLKCKWSSKWVSRVTWTWSGVKSVWKRPIGTSTVPFMCLANFRNRIRFRRKLLSSRSRKIFLLN